MPDLISIGTVISSVKTATDIAKLIKDSDLSLSAAENKLKIADLISALADVRLELVDVQSILSEKDAEIKQLKKIISDKKALSFDGKVYWIEGDDVPFCPVCFEKDDKSYHLTYFKGGDYSSERYLCKICENHYFK